MSKQNIVIIKYNAGNIRSVDNALKRLGQNAEITDDREKIARADKVIFPGVGEASTTMEYLNRTGLSELILSITKPVLGICLGMQLMSKHSEEGNTDSLGIFNESVIKFKTNKADSHHLKIPHMGWNKIYNLKGSLFDSSLEGEYVYFVHSYYMPRGVETVSTTDYGIPFSSAVQHNNFFATQFHPEKSGPVGERILNNFLKL